MIKEIEVKYVIGFGGKFVERRNVCYTREYWETDKLPVFSEAKSGVGTSESKVSVCWDWERNL